ncbi:MAG: ATP-binding cassette domain-containing protein, partial [Gammaproteobacteria bacterium]|nr:ATP-binding cassette domain-containing protein [Gammaproteobacteria bacterium]
KTTLLNILGCLLRPTGGTYRLGGTDVRGLDAGQLAGLRRETFGFVSQAPNLIESATALENVEVPGRYAGMRAQARRQRARDLLASVGLAERLDHLPGELSGGEQQRVAVARALMNGGRVILADEPTGSLDTSSGHDIMRLLERLSDAGHIVVVASHDDKLAERADRHVEIRDGELVAATERRSAKVPPRCASAPAPISLPVPSRWLRIAEALRDAPKAVRSGLVSAGRAGAALSVLSVALGVAAAATLLGVARGGANAGMEALTHVGADRIMVRGADAPVGVAPVWLGVDDVRAIIEGVGEVRAAAPVIRLNSNVLRGERVLETTVRTADLGHGWMQERALAGGVLLTDEDNARRAPVAILGSAAHTALFGPDEEPIGQQVVIDGQPFVVKGILEPVGEGRGSVAAARLSSLTNRQIYVPVQTALALLPASKGVDIEAYVGHPDQIERAARSIRDVLFRRHGRDGFQIRTAAGGIDIWQSERRAFQGMLAGIAAVAAISGGLAIMATMLVAVRRRVREVGIRIMVGARRSDISRQFLKESAGIAVLGGFLGVVVGGAALWCLAQYFVPVASSILDFSIVVAGAVTIGLVFGVWPALRAGGLDPIEALGAD